MFRNTGSSAYTLSYLSHAIFLAAFLMATVVPPASAQMKPRVRSITGFIRLDTGKYKEQIADTLKMLRNAKARYELAGYEVQTIRITTQPFPEYTKGMTKEAALSFFHDLDSAGKQEDILIGIGPALMAEKDDPAEAELLGEVLGATTHLRGTVVVANVTCRAKTILEKPGLDVEAVRIHGSMRPLQSDDQPPSFPGNERWHVVDASVLTVLRVPRTRQMLGHRRTLGFHALDRKCKPSTLLARLGKIVDDADDRDVDAFPCRRQRFAEANLGAPRRVAESERA